MKLLSDIVKTATNGEPGDKPDGSITRRRGFLAAVILLFAALSFVISVYSLYLSSEQLKMQRAIYSGISVPSFHVQIDGASTWSESVTGADGDQVNFRVEIKNSGEESLQDVLVRLTLPSGLRYIDGSTKVYNKNNIDGVVVSDNIVTNTGINIGDYAQSANVWVYCSATIVVEGEQGDRDRILRSIIETSGGKDINASASVEVGVEAPNVS